MDLTDYLCNNSSCSVKTEVIFEDNCEGKKGSYKMENMVQTTGCPTYFGTIK